MLLTGQRGLWAGTGTASYLDDGHRLIQNVIAASGWDLAKDQPIDDLSKLKPGDLPPWRGLGRGGVLEDQCDASSTCSQDSQTFKGIFFNHFTAFCAPLSSTQTVFAEASDSRPFLEAKAAHDTSCGKYTAWVRYNADAAMATRDKDGVFGMWWGAGVFPTASASRSNDGVPHDAPNSTDYRNYGLPEDGIWAASGSDEVWKPSGVVAVRAFAEYEMDPAQKPVGRLNHWGPLLPKASGPVGREERRQTSTDPNSRGRGRTVETQHGGLAVLRALWALQ